jgi:hypothetical protein
MDPAEIQAKATIAAALIAVHAVEVPTIAKAGSNAGEVASARLRALTDNVYKAITSEKE